MPSILQPPTTRQHCELQKRYTQIPHTLQPRRCTCPAPRSAAPSAARWWLQAKLKSETVSGCDCDCGVSLTRLPSFMLVRNIAATHQSPSLRTCRPSLPLTMPTCNAQRVTRDKLHVIRDMQCESYHTNRAMHKPLTGQNSFVPCSLQLQCLMRLFQCLKFPRHIRRRMHGGALGVKLPLAEVSKPDLEHTLHMSNLEFIAAGARDRELLLELAHGAAVFEVSDFCNTR